MDDFRTEKIGILTLKLDPALMNMSHESWVKMTLPPETMDKIKACDRLEIEVVPFDIAADINAGLATLVGDSHEARSS